MANNGLGSSIAECAAAVAGFVRAYPLLDDPPGLCAEWQTLVAADNCRGKVAHDARYVAAMRLHTLTHILTFNGSDFARFPGVTVLDPAAVAAGSAGPTPRS